MIINYDIEKDGNCPDFLFEVSFGFNWQFAYIALIRQFQCMIDTDSIQRITKIY